MSRYSALVLADTPSLYWRLGSSGLVDQSGNGRDGTAVGSPSIGAQAGAITGDADGATNLNGSTQYVTCSYAPFTLNSLRTFECWAKRTSTAAVDYLWGTSANPSPFLRLTAASNDVVFAPDSNSSFTTWTNTWPGISVFAHCVLTFNDSSNALDLSINGVSAGATTSAVTWTATASTFQLAQRGGGVGFWNGVLDEVAIYESVLSAAQIAEHYRVGREQMIGNAMAAAL